MKGALFLKLLSITIVVTVLLFFLINLAVPLARYIDLLVYSMLFFTIFSFCLYWLGQRAIRSKQGNFFLYIIMINVFVKLFASFLLVMAYANLNNPPDKFFVATFLLTYLTFTVFETYFLSIQARASK